MWQSFLTKVVPQAYAQCDPNAEGLNLGDCVTLGVGQGSVNDVYQNPSDLINPIINFMFIAGGIVFFFLLVYSGLKFISAGGKGKDEAKTIMQTAITGLVVMFVAFWIVRLLEVLTGMELVF